MSTQESLKRAGYSYVARTERGSSTKSGRARTYSAGWVIWVRDIPISEDDFADVYPFLQQGERLAKFKLRAIQHAQRRVAHRQITMAPCTHKHASGFRYVGELDGGQGAEKCLHPKLRL